MPESPVKLNVLKALGDNTRYAIYLELARAPQPRTTSEIAETLDVPLGTVKSTLHRALGTLRKEITR